MKLLVTFLLVQHAIADCVTANFANDPTPWGGAPCTKDADCGQKGDIGGSCDFTNSTGQCVCFKNYAMPNCTYLRTNPALAGGLNIGLPFAGLGGIGCIIIGRTGPGAGQLVLTLLVYAICFIACILVCCCGEAGAVVTYIIYLIFLCCFLSGFIWSIVDGAFILQCSYPDSLGYAMMN